MAKIYGAGKVTARLQNASQKSVTLVGQALFAGGDMIRAEAHRLIGEGSSSGHSGGKHQHIPSLPHDPPNRDTGTLQNNLETTQVAPLRVEVSSNAPYSAYLEFGTSRMIERPYMGPALRAKKKEVVALIKTAVNKALKG